MKNRKYYIYLLVFISAIVISSCEEDFLFKKPKGVVVTESLNTPEGVNKLLTGAYSLIDGAGTKGGWPTHGYAATITNWTFNVASDNAYSGGWPPPNEMERYAGTPVNFLVNDKWMVLYDGISRANDVLNALNIAGEELTNEEVKVIGAQAYFLRAFYHFRLQRVFYKIPYITEDVESPELVPNDHQVWNEIEADLQVAIEGLPESWTGEPGRITKYAAKAVKAYVHLHQQEYSQAKPLLDDIINSGKFDLVDDYHFNYTEAGDNNDESIFEVQRAVNDGTRFGNNGTAGSFTINPMNRFVPTCCGHYQPSQDLVNAFKTDENGLPLLGITGPKYNEENLKNDMGILSTAEFVPTDDPVDPRLDWTVGRRGIPYLDWGIYTGNEWLVYPAYGPYQGKKTMFSQAERPVASHEAFARSHGINTHLIRYAHVLLWRAECAVEDNDLNLALELVNRIRRRASDDFVMGKCTTYKFESGTQIEVDWDQPAANYLLGEYPSFPSQEYAREAVQLELRLETAMEGNRFFDLRRWEIDGKVLPEYISNDVKFRTFLTEATYDPEKNDYWPLPQSQLDIQEGVLVQDPSY